MSKILDKLKKLITARESVLPDKTLLSGFSNQPNKGVLVEYHKSDSTQSGRSHTLPILPNYSISLMQRNGELSIPTVKVGDYVLKGQIIAAPTSKVALYRHAPTSGTVVAIDNIRELHPSKLAVPAITIQSDFLDKSSDYFQPLPDYEQIDKATLLQRIYQSGIAGMGGAGFPAEKKIDLEHDVDVVIINGAECEPYLTCDDILMRESAEQILRGAQVIAHILSATQIIVGIEDDKEIAIAKMRQAAEIIADKRIKIVAMPTFYPMGSRQQIAHYLLGKKTIVGKRSHLYGFICHNVATAKAYYEAVCLGRPSIDRLITVSGDAVENGKVLNVRVGTRLIDIFDNDLTHEVKNNSSSDLNDEFVKLKNNDNQAIDLIVGGTMMGFNIDFHESKSFVIKKETTSILAFANKTKLIAQKQEKNCIRCGDCVEVCPINLLPQQLYFFGKAKQLQKAVDYRLFDCIECGCCAYVCPSEIPLVQYIQNTKGEVNKERNKQKSSEAARTRFENRVNRIEAEKAEKIAKAEEKRLLLEKKQSQAEGNIAAIEIVDKAENADKATDKSSVDIGHDLAKPIDIHSAVGNEAQLIAEALARTKIKKEAFIKKQLEQQNLSDVVDSTNLDKNNE